MLSRVSKLPSLNTLGAAAPRAQFSFSRAALPPIAGEPFQHYEPGSKSRAAILKSTSELRSRLEGGDPIEVPCIVGGQEIRTGDIAEQVMPSQHGTVVARFHKANPEVLNKAADAALEAQAEWARLPFTQRASVFRKAADLISQVHRYDLNAAVMLGTGKTVWQAEIDSAVELCDFFRMNCNFAEQLYEIQPPLNSPAIWNRTEYRPLEGFVAAISPFNFCAIGGNLPGAPALMGNTVVWKPSHTAVYGNYLVMKILQEAGLPDGVINFLPSDGPTFGDTLVPRPEFAGLHFTGSTKTMNHLWGAVSHNLEKGAYKNYPRVVGETGGKNFHLVHESAHLENAVNNTLRGAFEYQGQKCSATSRLYVPDSLWTKFRDSLLEKMPNVKLGQPDRLDTFLSAVIDETSFDNIKSFIDAARDDPECEIIFGGNCDKSQGYFIEPTIIKVKNPRHALMTTELFGPVLTVYEYPAGKFEETLELVDTSVDYGLTGSIFAQDRNVIHRVDQKLSNSAGNFYINDKSTGAVVGEQPFGGGRVSGTNDKAGSIFNLIRWVSPRSIKENSLYCEDWTYPYMQNPQEQK